MKLSDTRDFTDEFKARTVQLVKSSGKLVMSVARELGLTVSSLRNWVMQADVDGESQDSCRLKRYANATTRFSLLRPSRGRLSETSASARHLRTPRDQRAGLARRASS